MDPPSPLRITIGEPDDGRRLDAVVAGAGGLSRGTVAEMVAAGAVTVDGRVEAKSYRVSVGEVVEARPPQPEKSWDGPVSDVHIVHEDDHLLVVDKPAGMVVHAAPGLRESTLVDSLLARDTPLAPRAGHERPGVVHRLDRDVSGLLILARTDETHEALVEGLAAREIRREYLACVLGDPAVDAGKIEAPVGRHPRHRTRMSVLPDGKPAVTWFRVRERFGDVTLLEIRLETGRTHQIRVHLSSIDHPIIGDVTYGRDPRLAREVGLERPFLHAYRLGFTHPVTGEDLVLTSELPADLSGVLERLRSG